MLPQSAAPKLIDIWLFAHVAVLFLVFLSQMLVIYLHNRKQNQIDACNEKKKAKQKLKKMIKQSTTTTISPIVSNF